MFELIFESLATLRSNLLRTILTMIGVILGVGAVVSIMSVGTSAYSTVSEEFLSSGLSALSLTNINQTAPPLDEKTIEYIKRQNIPGIVDYQPTLSMQAEAVDQLSNTLPITLVGAMSDYVDKQNLTMLNGSFITPIDEDSMSQVIVVDNTTTDKFFYSQQEAIGKKLRIDGVSYKIIGVYKSVQPFVQDKGLAFTPFSTLERTITGSRGYNKIDFLISETADAGEVQDQLIIAMMQRRGFANKDHVDFYVSNPSNQLESIQQFFTVFSVFMSLIAAISLLVGGVGIMNIMLVSVTERTKEIGLFKALGAQKTDIVFQFLVESVVLTVFGGLIGVGLGIGVAFTIIQVINLFDFFPEFLFKINYISIFVSLIVSITIGLTFGAYPAKKAADLDPVEALRRE